MLNDGWMVLLLHSLCICPIVGKVERAEEVLDFGRAFLFFAHFFHCRSELPMSCDSAVAAKAVRILFKGSFS